MNPKIKGWAVALVLIGAIVIAAIIGQRGSNPQADRVVVAISSTVEQKQWYEVSRVLSQSEALDLRIAYGWMHVPINPPGPNVKVLMQVQSAASEPERVMYAVMDEQNFERMKAGYPPLALASNAIGRPTLVEVPYGQRYWFGFVEVAHQPSSPEGIPTSLSGALLYVLNEYQRANRPPVRLTCEIYTIIRMYGTATEARRAILELKRKAGQP